MKIAELLQQLLSRGSIDGNQRQLVKVLADVGVTTTQSSVSRALKKINAIKSVDDRGKSIYTLKTSAQVQQLPSRTLDFFESLIHGIEYNDHLIVIHTTPGTAMTVAKFIDDKKFDEVMGTVAGDDTIMIAPKNVNLTPILADQVKVYLSSIGLME